MPGRNEINSFSITFPFSPVAKARPRVFRKVTITPTKTVEFEQRVKLHLMTVSPPLLEGPLKAEVTFYFKRPKSVSVKKRPYPSIKPDLDNLQKSLFDSMNGMLFHDDSQIVDLEVKKRYGDSGKIDLMISQIVIKK